MPDHAAEAADPQHVTPLLSSSVAKAVDHLPAFDRTGIPQPPQQDLTFGPRRHRRRTLHIDCGAGFLKVGGRALVGQAGRMGEDRPVDWSWFFGSYHDQVVALRQAAAPVAAVRADRRLRLHPDQHPDDPGTGQVVARQRFSRRRAPCITNSSG